MDYLSLYTALAGVCPVNMDYILRLSLNHLEEYRFDHDCFALTSRDGANQPLAIPDRTGPSDNPRAARQPRETPLGCKKPQGSGEQWNQVPHMKTGSPLIVGFLLMLSQSILLEPSRSPTAHHIGQCGKV